MQFEPIKTKGIKTSKLTAMGTRLEANSMTPILDAIEAAHEAVKSTGAKRIISSIKIAERLESERSESKSEDFSMAQFIQAP
jgi:uncharacterized protein YqgV (UPF0045/DUF77 family)